MSRGDRVSRLDALRPYGAFVKEGFPLLEKPKSKPAMLAVGMKDRGSAPEVQDRGFSGHLGQVVLFAALPDAGHFRQEDYRTRSLL